MEKNYTTESYSCPVCNCTDLKYQHPSHAIGTLCECPNCKRIYFIGFDGLEGNINGSMIPKNVFEMRFLEFEGKKIYFHPEQFKLFNLEGVEIPNHTAFNRLVEQSNQFLDTRAKLLHIKKVQLT